MRGIEKLTLDNHTLYRRVQHLVRLNWSWEAIALDVGVYQVNDLCQWVLDYREPKKLPMVNISNVHDVPVKAFGLSRQAEKFIAWKKQNEGARAARETMEAMGQ